MNCPSTADLAAHLVANAGANADSAALLAGMMLDRLRYPAEGGAPAVVDRDGRPALDMSGAPKTVEALIGDMRRELPQLFTAAKLSAPTAAARLGVTGRTLEAANEYAAAQQRAANNTPPNPFARRTWNLTQQVLLKARNPALASRLATEAGVR